VLLRYIEYRYSEWLLSYWFKTMIKGKVIEAPAVVANDVIHVTMFME